MVSGARWRVDVARRTTARMRRGTEATWKGREWPTRGAGGAQGADTWQEATRVHVGPCGRPCGVPRGKGVSIWRSHGVVGPGKMIGAVTRKRYTAPQFKLDIFHIFFCVGLCPTRFLPVQDTWRLSGRRIQRHRLKRVDMVDMESTRSPSRARAQIRNK